MVRIIKLCGSCAVALAALELGLRVIQPTPVFSPLLPLYPYVNREIHTTIRGVTSPAKSTTNKWGLRGDEPPKDWTNAVTILCVGGSTTHCYVIDDSKTWSALLQKKLRDSGVNAWVGNAGMHGHSTIGHAIVVRDVVSKIKPDYVLFLVGINDALLPSESYSSPQKTASLFLREHSRIAQVLYTLKRRHVNKDATVTEENTGYVKGPRKEGYLPLDTNRLAAYEKRIDNLITECQQTGTAPIFATQPLPFDDTPEWDKYDSWTMLAGHSVSASNLAFLVESYNLKTIEVCAARGVACVDLANAMPHSEEYFTDFCHFNDAGCELVSEIIAHNIRQPLAPSR